MVTSMKILVFSDSHGRMDLMVDAVERERPDHIFFLGDHYRDGLKLSGICPRIPMNAVRGNCDWGPGPDEKLVELEGVRFLLTHGHLHNAKAGYRELISAGRRAGVDMVCFGHTHRAEYVPAEDGLWLFNPGTAGGVHARAGYGVLTAEQGRVTGELK